ncbi:BBSome-interacting protein 1, partial [Trichinella murrelli]
MHAIVFNKLNQLQYSNDSETMNSDSLLSNTGLLFDEFKLDVVFCKPKIMPLKSMTLIKLEKLQKQIEEKLKMTENQDHENHSSNGTMDPNRKPNVDIWKA